nr:PREDICTED: uncharacterized protein LOC109042446 [Bemisia tabaci]
MEYQDSDIGLPAMECAVSDVCFPAMGYEDLDACLPAVWLVFGGSYLNHSNAPRTTPEAYEDNFETPSSKEPPDHREKILVDLLSFHLETEFVRFSESFIESTQLQSVLNLLKLWSEDLTFIYEIREQLSINNNDYDLKEKILVQRILSRIKTFDFCTIIPNGLISAEHLDGHENVNLAILQKKGCCIDWIQVNPGGQYHQSCHDLIDVRSNAFLKISDVDINNITEEWVHLLLTLKSIRPRSSYQELMLYEWLLPHLNGKTVFQSEPDDGFVTHSHSSPSQIWQVVDQSFRYLLWYFIGDVYQPIYQEVITSFKIFLMEKVLTAFQDQTSKNIEQCHFLLQEMCPRIAQQALEFGNEKQKEYAFHLIQAVKAAIDYRCSQQQQELASEYKVGRSLNFPAIVTFPSLRLPELPSSSRISLVDSVQAHPNFVKPKTDDDIIDYLRKFQRNFVDQLKYAEDFDSTVLLCSSIESFFIDFLANTDILEASRFASFSKNDGYLASCLKYLAELYYVCQARLVHCFLKDVTYEPHSYTKNVIIQFFMYASVAALNLRHARIGPLLAEYNFSTACSDSLTLPTIIPYLVVEDSRWLSTLFSVQSFFHRRRCFKKGTLFSCNKFRNIKPDCYMSFSADVKSEDMDLEEELAYNLLQTDTNSLKRFNEAYEKDDDKYRYQDLPHKKWIELTYTCSKDYLPDLYILLPIVAHSAKVALTGFNFFTGDSSSFSPEWNSRRFGSSLFVYFKINKKNVSTKADISKLTSYRYKSNGYYADPYQRFISHYEKPRDENAKEICLHLHENDFIANLCIKPDTMDCNRFLQLGFLQSEPHLKLERLYIGLKENQLNFSSIQEGVLIKQTLFEISITKKIDEKPCSWLTWTASHKPELIHSLGLLFIEKARVMEYRLTQHYALGDILIVTLGLLTFYPSTYKNALIEGILDIFYLLKKILTEPPAHLSGTSLLHLNAYLIISAQAKPQLLETELATLLKAFLMIQKYKVKGVHLDSSWRLRLHAASFEWHSQVAHQLREKPDILNDIMSSVIPQWNQESQWQETESNWLFRCGDYTIKPLHGCIYFQNQPLMGLPSSITEHKIFREYLGVVNFAVIPEKCQVNSETVPCYCSVDHEPRTRLTLVRNILFIEEWIEDGFQRYIPADEISCQNKYPQALYELPNKAGKLRHWLKSSTLILIKDQNRKVVYEWDLQKNTVLSLLHGGFVVPWNQVEVCFFKTWLERIESADWIELIVQPSLNDAFVLTESLNLPRLGLHFEFKEGKFYSKQIHGYIIAESQLLNTLPGFLNYLVIEKKERSSAWSVKVIIPHRLIKPKGPFYDKSLTIDTDLALLPPYFVYDYDFKLDMLKGHRIQAQLYLALIFYRSASFDSYDISNCNTFHLARENLELCWKDQPYDEIELSIIEQFLKVKVEDIRGFHSHSLAIYLKVVSLLISSLRLEFLYTDENAKSNKERSRQLLTKLSKTLPRLFLTYLQNKPTIFSRIQLSLDEEQDVINQCLPQTSNSLSIQQEFPDVLCLLKVYNEVNFELQSKTLPPLQKTKPFNSFYGQFFSKDNLQRTNFEHIYQKNLEYFKFSYDTEKYNWTKNVSSDIDNILSGRFHVKDYITLYDLAKNSLLSLPKYCYLLHYVVMTQTEVPSEMKMMLARSLLLVAEHPANFPESPRWFHTSNLSVNLKRRKVLKDDVIGSFPLYHRKRAYDANEMDIEEEKQKEDKYKAENERIWRYLKCYDLDEELVPNCLPQNTDDFQLKYERHMTFDYPSKQQTVRQIYLKSAYNDSMFYFFYHVLNLCDNIKHSSHMGWPVAEFISETIKVPFEARIENSLTFTSEQVSLENLATLQEPLVDLNQFFAVDSSQCGSSTFLFESQLEEPKNGYQHKFYSELKDSWLAYQNEKQFFYSWLSPQSMKELEMLLQTKLGEIRKQTEQLWDFIATQFEQKSNSESNDYFALRWYSGRAIYYNKRDILTLLIEPHKVGWYNPDCLSKKDHLIKELLNYLIHKINSAKVIRVLNLIEQYKETDNDAEQFSVMQSLVRSLQEDIDPASFQYPHWILFQYENEIIVRNNQQELITAMLNQREKAMYQLNMGEGKSSVILPLLSYNLANGNHILRINVLSALLITMKEFLRQRFSGLIRKHIYTLPFDRQTEIPSEHIALISEMLRTCQSNKHILLVTPEHRLCLQLKERELLLESQQQMDATNTFSWKTYRQRAELNNDFYKDLTELEVQEMLLRQDECLKACLQQDGYIDSEDSDTNTILRPPPRGQARMDFAHYKKVISDTSFREWSCLRAAYRELLYNSTFAHASTSETLTQLSELHAFACIDLLDESDEILKNNTELNYTVGDRCAFSGGEFRWEIPQFFIKAIFCDDDVREVIDAGKVHGFTAINPGYSEGGGVPFIQLLSESYFDNKIKPLLLEKFFHENLLSLRKYQTSADSHSAEVGISSLRQYTAGQLPLNAEKDVVAFLADKGALKDKILIAKGWLSHGILFHVFNAKYRVQFGLNLNAEGETTKLIAIPFLGKDTPSPRSEFSHPDVMLGFTIICYLYKGLTQKELKETLLSLKSNFSTPVGDMQLDTWTQAGEAWIRTRTDHFPPLVLTSLQHVDLADELCLAQMHQYLSRNYLAIFFYLNQFVLLEEAMQYRHKISANAHSLVGYNAALGFSGTDDRKITMPFQVKSLCSTSQVGTNGKLLSVLTQDRNSHYHTLKTDDSKALLRELCQFVTENRHCHALIDAGALITGLTNSDVANFLLIHLPETFVGILYFSDEGNNLIVGTRDGKTAALQDCYLDKKFLFAYLDDIHTRGTDIQLPLHCHAILTIGMGMLKDKLMQAAMRLRQLAQKQCVTLWGTQAVSFAIARDNNIDPSRINSLEVIKWVTKNTIDHINEDLFHVAVRKINFEFLKRAEVWLKEAPAHLSTLVQCCQDKELFQLEEFYALSPQSEDLADRLGWLVAGRFRSFWQEMELEFRNKNLIDTPFYEKVFNRCTKNAFKEQLFAICDEMTIYLQQGLIHHSLDGDEEKENEVEIVQERQVLIKREYRCAYQEKRWDVQLIFKENFLKEALDLAIIMPLSAVSNFVQSPSRIEDIVWHKDIYMTVNYIQSVKCEQNDTIDNYLRPVDVVLIHRSSDKSEALLLSGREASRIKSRCCKNLENNLLVHINDIDGHTQLPTGIVVNEQEQKLLTIVKLFAGECHYESLREVQRIAELVGRIHPLFFSSLSLNGSYSEELYEILIQGGYIDYAGVMTQKLLNILWSVKAGDLFFEFPEDLQLNEKLSKKVHGMFKELIIKSTDSLQKGHYVLWQWVGARNRLREYHGSALESVINSDYQIKCTQ